MNNIRRRDITKFAHYDKFRYRSIDDLLGKRIESGFHELHINNRYFDFILIKRESKTLFVTFSAAAGIDKNTYPIFSGLKLGNRDEVDLLALSDIAQSGTESLKTSWHLGTHRVPTTTIILKLLNKLKRENKYNNIVIFGSSAGGFAALNISRHVPGSTAVVMNPRTDLKASPTTFAEYIKVAHGNTNPLRREDLSMPLAYSRKTLNKVVYIQNLQDLNYFNNHYIPFEKSNINKTKYITGNWGIGHVVPPEWVYSNVLNTLFQGKKAAEQFFEAEFRNHENQQSEDKFEKIKKHVTGAPFSKRGDDVPVANRLLAGSIVIQGRPDVPLDIGKIWSLDPFSDNNWKFNLHSLRWIDPLRRQFIATQNREYLDKYRDVLWSWYQFHIENERHTPYSWYDMAVGSRVKVIVAAMEVLPNDREWLEKLLLHHGHHLGDGKFLSRSGNHALHAMIGLTICGDYFDRKEWISQAQDKITALFDDCVDSEGVDYEGAIQYQVNNYKWYREAAEHIEISTGLLPAFSEKLNLMLVFLAHATNTLGKYVQYGDSDSMFATTTLGNELLEYAGSRGKRGLSPDNTYKNYSAGYVFGRTGWSTSEFEKGIFYSLRYGPSFAKTPHGHRDAGTLTLTAGNAELIFESGRYRYDLSDMSKFLQSPQAHSTVGSPNGQEYDEIRSACLRSEFNDNYDWTVITKDLSGDGIWYRSVLHLRKLKALLVVDDFVHTEETVLDQYWQLGKDSTFECNGHQILSPIPDTEAKLALSWQSNSETTFSLSEGETSPLAGWRSVKHGESFAAPTLNFVYKGQSIRAAMLIGTTDLNNFSLDPVVEDSSFTTEVGESGDLPWNLQATVGTQTLRLSIPAQSKLSSALPIVETV
ncbi:heparinase II/III family protein [Glutamicibacter ardleyensis]|uniref:heparinase II/III family protein n=1 Tax=Glutamicibacter ardleyensis TaxID=225894 RepID=UPI003FD02523